MRKIDDILNDLQGRQPIIKDADEMTESIMERIFGVDEYADEDETVNKDKTADGNVDKDGNVNEKATPFHIIKGLSGIRMFASSLLAAAACALLLFILSDRGGDGPGQTATVARHTTVTDPLSTHYMANAHTTQTDAADTRDKAATSRTVAGNTYGQRRVATKHKAPSAEVTQAYDISRQTEMLEASLASVGDSCYMDYMERVISENSRLHDAVNEVTALESGASYYVKSF